MKIRTGFVSNSSSSSFLILKRDLTEQQIIQIRDHATLVIGMIDLGNTDQPWNIEEDDLIIEGATVMDNFDMRQYLDRIGVASQHIRWWYS